MNYCLHAGGGEETIKRIMVPVNKWGPFPEQRPTQSPKHIELSAEPT